DVYKRQALARTAAHRGVPRNERRDPLPPVRPGVCRIRAGPMRASARTTCRAKAGMWKWK
ncbi:hypothetical protein, partial [Streptomyces sp. rh206]|uniref:hypothetical protein n=1 Tax=Streptomyces sp. rh206 TaxID=2034270 RepID=UPI001C54CAEE